MTTPNERAANEFDCDLYRLISRAEVLEKTDVGCRLHWREIAKQLRTTRTIVRPLMSREDRRATA